MNILSQMSKSFRTDLIYYKYNIQVIESGEFSEQEWDILDLFKREENQLSKSDAIMKIKVNLNLNWNREQGFTDHSTLPSDDDLNNLLHRLRPFVLKDEPIYFNKVCNILKKHLKNEFSQKLIQDLKDLFSGKEFQSTKVQIEFNKETINSEKTLYKWLNAYQYHRDKGKQVEIETIHKLLPSQTTKAIFIYMMIDKAKAIRDTAEMIRILEDSLTNK
jgi:hypothetical protein